MVTINIIFTIIYGWLTLVNCMLMLREFFFKPIGFASKQFVLFLLISAMLSALRILYRDSDNLWLMALSGILELLQTGLIFAFLPAKTRRKPNLIIFALTYQTVVSIIAQTTLYFFNIDIGINIANSAIILDIVGCAWAAVILNLLIFFQNRVIFRRISRALVELPTGLFFLFLATLFFIGQLENGVFSSSTKVSFLEMITSVLVFLSVVLLIGMLLLNRSKVNTETMVDLLTSQMEEQLRHYVAMRKYEDEVRAFRHDFGNMVFCLRVILESDNAQEARTYLDTMYTKVATPSQRFDTGNLVADALLGAKAYLAKEDDIMIEMKGVIPSTGLKPFDLCIFLSNAIDNATEACKSLPGSKTIRVNSTERGGFWWLSVSNPVDRPVEIRKGRVVTTKIDKSAHGFGIPNMQRIAKKYNGKLHFLSEEGMFHLEAMLLLSAETAHTVGKEARNTA